MKTIKIIDLLNKIANGEEVPKKIKLLYANDEYTEMYEYNHWVGDYTMIGEKENLCLFSCFVFGTNNSKNRLNDEIEILDEEDEFEDIEEFVFGEVEDAAHYEMKDKINQLIKNQKKIIEMLKKEGK